MVNETWRKLLTKDVVLLDGGWGTEFQKNGLPPGMHPDLCNLENPELTKQVAKSYVDAGSDVILTNTFGANRFVLENEFDVVASAERVPAHNERAVFLEVFAHFVLLIKDMRFELNYGGLCLELFEKVFDRLLTEVRQPDRSRLSFGERLFKNFISLNVVAKRPMEEKEIDVRDVEPFERLVDR